MFIAPINQLPLMKSVTRLLSFIAAITFSQAQAQVTTDIYTEDFTSTSTGNQVGDWIHSGAPNWAVTTDSTLDSSSPHHVYFTTASQENVEVPFAGVSLSVDQGIQVTFDYRYTAAPDDPGNTGFNFFRFGLYNNQNTAGYGDDHGYLADVSYWDNMVTSANKSGDYSLREENNVFADFDLGPLLDNNNSSDSGPPASPESGDIVTMFEDDDVTSSNFTKTTVDGTSVHTVTLLIGRQNGGVEVSLFHDGSTEAILEGWDDDGYVTTFNTVFFESPSDNNGFMIDNLSIQTLSAVPEPSTYAAIFGGLGLMFAAWRRRR